MAHLINADVILGLLVALTVTVIATASPRQPSPTPPTFPDAFSVSFTEIEVLKGKLLNRNNGSWFYDFKNKRARFDHDAGQRNNFCAFQNLSPKDPSAACQLFFTPTEDMIVFYPGVRNCCRLCGEAEGCTILKPSWLQQDSHLSSVETINGMQCYGWAKKGAVAAADTWYATAGGLPCRYHEVVSNIDHNLTFVPNTFKVGPLLPSIFEFPRWCNKPCPHPFKPPLLYL